ncbi:MAG TPA: endonuclease/exonuclease/phosphatase family protein [Chitinophagaceae bacterium]
MKEIDFNIAVLCRSNAFQVSGAFIPVAGLMTGGSSGFAASAYLREMITRPMRKLFCIIILPMLSLTARAQSDTLVVVNWNIEWFGSYSNGPGNENLQEQNVVRVMRYLNADIYGLMEVVDTMRLRRVVDSLGPAYGFYVSGFASAAPSPISPNWSSAQKLAFVYRRSVFSNIHTRAMLNNGSNAYYNFSSGRFPYLFNANVTKNGKKRNISFILIHAKAGSTATDYSRRRDAAIELKDTLDPFFSARPLIIFGDLNDELEGSISGYTVSPYDVFVRDSLPSDTASYYSLTLPAERAGERSTINYSNVIDHQIANLKMDSMYVPGSADIRQDVVEVVPDYLSHTTSDHYPVSSKFVLKDGDTSAVVVNPPPPPPPPVVFKGFRVWPNPFRQQIIFRSGKNLTEVKMVMYNSIGARVWETAVPVIISQQFNEFPLPLLSSGVYLLQIISREETLTFRLVR